MGNRNRYASLILLGALIYPFLTGPANSQQLPTALISGRILDKETEKPLDNVIVYLTNTFWGTSTDTLGRFVLTNIDSGDYDLIISRIGYVRQLKHIQLKENDTLYYEVELVAQPVQAGGVEVYGERAERVEPKLNLFPSTKDKSYCVYGVETSLPIGILFTDSAFYMYSLEPTIVNQEKFIRLWLLYFNVSQNPHDFNPYKAINLNLITKATYYHNISAIRPSEIIMSINNESAIDSAKEIFCKQIEKMASLHRIALKWELRFLAGLMSPEAFAHYVATDCRTQLSGITFENIIHRSVNDGILKQHIVYPNNGVHGFLFFPYPGLNWKASNNKFYEAYLNQYELEITTPTETKTIVFTAH